MGSLLLSAACDVRSGSAEPRWTRSRRYAWGIDWAENIKAVSEVARSEKRLVFWLRMLGDLEGGS